MLEEALVSKTSESRMPLLRRLSFVVFLSLTIVGSLLLPIALQAESLTGLEQGFQTESQAIPSLALDISERPWESYMGTKFLPPPDQVYAGLQVFLNFATEKWEEFERAGKTPQEFLSAVRAGKFYWIVGEDFHSNDAPRPAENQAYGDEINGLGDITKYRFELIKVEEAVGDLDEKGRLKNKRTIERIAIKFAPPESELTRQELKESGVRIVFYNVDHPLNRDVEPINPEGQGPDIYHARINVKTKRNVLVLSMKGNEIVWGKYIERSRLLKDGPIEWWGKIWKANSVPIDWIKNPRFGALSATAHTLVPIAATALLSKLGVGHAHIPVIAMIATWVNVFTLTTFSKTYANFVRNKTPNKEIFMRVLIDLPFAIFLAVATHSDLGALSTWISMMTISTLDKSASFVYSFLPMVAEDRGVTAGKKIFGVPATIVFKDVTGIIRMFWRQAGVIIASVGGVQMPLLGSALVWLSAVPVYFVDLGVAKRLSQEFPKMFEDIKRLKGWMNPMTYLRDGYADGKHVCQDVLSFLFRKKRPTMKTTPERF
jgi:hypothetical protein